MLLGRKPSDVYPITDNDSSRSMSEIEIAPVVNGVANLKDAEDAPFIHSALASKRGVTCSDDINQVFYGSIEKAQEMGRNLSKIRKKKIENSNFSSTTVMSSECKQKTITINVVASSSPRIR